MFSWASKPGEYVEGTTADRNSNLTNFSSHNLDPSDFHSPGPGLATPPCLICPANHLFRHAHLSNNPICEGRGLFAGGGKRLHPHLPRVPFAVTSRPLGAQVLILAWPCLTLGRPTCSWCDLTPSFALPVLSPFILPLFISTVVCVAMVVMQRICNT